jgi:RNA-directed DNA polymerase
MRRVGGLWDSVMERGNWVRAFHQAARGKRLRGEVRSFGSRLDENLERVMGAVSDGSFEVGRFEVFRVYEPKERVIHAVPFEERVFQHALMNVCEPILDARLISACCACRRGKGQPAAVQMAQRGARDHDWYLKLDIRKYFESVPHEVLIEGLNRVFKDPSVLSWFERIIRSHASAPGRGLPIGSLTSQHLANFHLARLDRFCTGHAWIGRYVRYMDDFVCWSSRKDWLIEVGRNIEALVGTTLGLALKHPPCPQSTARGMNFLGYRIFPSHMTLNRTSRVRYARKVRMLSELHGTGELSDRQVQERLTALVAFTLAARATGFRRRVHRRLRSTAIGREPRESWRELEQHREQLHRGQPEQQHPDQQQHEQRVPCRLKLRPCPPAMGSMERGLNRPSSGSRVSARVESECSPSGIGSVMDLHAKVPDGHPLLGDGVGGTNWDQRSHAEMDLPS